MHVGQAVLLRQTLAGVDVRPTAEGWGDLASACDLRAGIAVAEATLRCAVERRETRGCHNRSDFPTRDPTLQVNLHCRRVGDDALSVWSEPVPPMAPELLAWVAESDAPDLAGRLLE